jgi:hypothetical protein
MEHQVCGSGSVRGRESLKIHVNMHTWMDGTPLAEPLLFECTLRLCHEAKEPEWRGLNLRA